MSKMTKDQFDYLYSNGTTHSEYNELIEAINARVDEICEIFIIKSSPKAWYDFDNSSGEDVAGCFDPIRHKETIRLTGDDISPPFGYQELAFPTRWLWEDFEKELAATEEAANQKVKDNKLRLKKRRLARKKELESVMASVKSKLTPAEYKWVKFKLA